MRNGGGCQGQPRLLSLPGRMDAPRQVSGGGGVSVCAYVSIHRHSSHSTVSVAHKWPKHSGWWEFVCCTLRLIRGCKLPIALNSAQITLIRILAYIVQAFSPRLASSHLSLVWLLSLLLSGSLSACPRKFAQPTKRCMRSCLCSTSDLLDALTPTFILSSTPPLPTTSHHVLIQFPSPPPQTLSYTPTTPHPRSHGHYH